MRNLINRILSLLTAFFLLTGMLYTANAQPIPPSADAAPLRLCSDTPPAALPNDDAVQYEQVRITGQRRYDYAFEVLTLVNAERAKEGLAALSMDQSLTESAMFRGAEVALLFSHTRPDGTKCFSINGKMFAENIAANQVTPEQAMESWMTSEGHRKNIMNSSYKSIGIGCFIINGTYYWVQCFGYDKAVSFTQPSNQTVTEPVRLRVGTFPSLTSPTYVEHCFSLNLSAEKTALAVGDVVTVAPTISAGSASFRPCPIVADCLNWSAAPAGVLTVQNNKITAKGSGTATLTAATSGGLISATLGFTVTCKHPTSRIETTQPTCTKTGSKKTVCTVCGKTLSETVIPALGHNWDGGTVTLQPTIQSEGVKTFTCLRCGATKTEPVPINPFVDVKEGKYYYNAVLWCFYHTPYQITKGTDDTHFTPSQTCSRAQVVSFLWNAKGKPEPDVSDNPFMDVKPGKYYYKAVLWAYQTGITKGADDTHFNPSGVCNRAQVVSFLWNAEGKPDPTSQENSFVDVKPSKYYYKAVLWAVETGITKGVDATHFGPSQICTRGQVVTFLYNALAK